MQPADWPNTVMPAIENNNIAHADYLIGSTRNDITVTSEMLAAGEKSPVYQSSAAFSLKLEELGRAPPKA